MCFRNAWSYIMISTLYKLDNIRGVVGVYMTHFESNGNHNLTLWMSINSTLELILPNDRSSCGRNSDIEYDKLRVCNLSMYYSTPSMKWVLLFTFHYVGIHVLYVSYNLIVICILYTFIKILSMQIFIFNKANLRKPKCKLNKVWKIKIKLNLLFSGECR